MKKLILTSIILLVMSAGGWAQNTPSEHLSFKNPFESALPKRQEPIIIQPTPELIMPVRPLPTPIETRPEQEIIPPSLLISGVIWNTDRPQAIINNMVVNIGDVVEEAKIIDINRSGIKIQYMEKNFTIEK
ncbi:MAG: hypothetical protein ABIJ41_00965 [Candidatus Omnitrophota bacterium]